MTTSVLSRTAAATAAALCLALAAPAAAGTISSISAPLGPGGDGVAWSLSSGSGNNEDRTPATNNSNVATNSGITFVELDHIDSEFTVQPSNGVHEYILFHFSVVNSTPVSWTEFVFQLLPGQLIELTFDTPADGSPGERTPEPVLSIPSASFSTGPSVHDPELLIFDLSGSPLPPGRAARITISLDVPDIPGFTLRMNPVPEPTTALLLLLGGSTVLALRRRS